jgi:pimeloyl-ACP methyl ester carboxylesterase
MRFARTVAVIACVLFGRAPCLYAAAKPNVLFIGIDDPEQQLFAGRTIDQPSIFISGASDWGSYQSPGALERMQNRACTDMRSVHMVDGAGHWVQQEQPEQTSRLLIEFLRG